MDTRKISRFSKAYPEKLAAISRMPDELYVRGHLPDPSIPSVGIIGARRCTEYGLEMARLFGGRLASMGVQIISGMASGVDGTAQLAAIEAGGESFGVLGCGCDICYPESNRRLHTLLQEHGGLISELPDGTQPLPYHFPMRNRIISALSDIILVVEARHRSGTLITVDFALEQGREVFAVPGRVSDVLSQGCNELIVQGAGMALEPDCIIEALGRLYPEGLHRAAAKQHPSNRASAHPAEGFSLHEKQGFPCNEKAPRREPDFANELQRKLYSLCTGRGLPADVLFERLSAGEDNGLKINAVMRELVFMEMKNLVFRDQNGAYVAKAVSRF